MLNTDIVIERDGVTEIETLKKKAKPRRMALTAFDIKHLKKPDGIGEQVTYWDSTEPGLGIRLSSTGVKTWTLMCRVLRHGRKELDRYTLGRYPALSLVDAREEARKIRQQIKDGKDPKHTKEDAEAEAMRRSRDTFASVVERFLADYGNEHLSENTRKEYRRTLLGNHAVNKARRKRLPCDCVHLHDKPISEITRRDIIEILDRIRQRGSPVQANRALVALQSLMSWAIQKDYIAIVPTDHIKAPSKETPRERHLFGNPARNRPSEITLAWRAFDAIGPLGALPKLLLLTGQRRSEVSDIVDGEVPKLDDDSPGWLIPAERTKNGKEHLVPLGPLAVKVLRSVPRFPKCPYLFSTNGKKPVSGFSKLKASIDKQIAELIAKDPEQYPGQMKEPWTLHDLRRTFKTGLAELGVKKEIRDALLNHTKQGIDAHYDHAEHGPAKREAMLKWEQYIIGLLKNGY